MASSTTAKSILSRFAMRVLQHIAGNTNKQVVDLDPTGSGKGLPLARLHRVAVGVLLNSPSATPLGGLAEFELVAATDAGITGSVTVVKASDIFGGATPAAIGDTLWLEADVAQIREVLPTAAFVGVRVKVADADDIVSLVTIKEGLDEFSGQTADYDA